MSLYRDQGVVLRTIKLGETDRIVTILTQGHGKIRAVAKGVRKPRSRFGARLEPTTHVAFQCYRGRSDLDVVTQVETIDANRALREHYGCLTHAVSMLEATDQVAQEREPNAALYRMLVGRAAHAGGRALARSSARRSSGSCSRSRASIRCSTPVRGCGNEAERRSPAFDLEEGGVLCEHVRAPRAGGALPPESLALLRRILGGDLRGALAEPPSATTHRRRAPRARSPSSTTRAPAAQRRAALTRCPTREPATRSGREKGPGYDRFSIWPRPT